MPDQDAMAIGERRKVLHLARLRDRKAERRGRAAPLGEVQPVTGMEPKTLMPPLRAAWSDGPGNDYEGALDGEDNVVIRQEAIPFVR